MAWTNSDLQALEDAIKLSARRVKYKDGEIEYRSLDEMLAVRRLIRKELGLSSSKKRVNPSFSKGL